MLVVPSESPLAVTLQRFAREARMVFFAGLPGTGKSLMIRELAHRAASEERAVHLLQWDVARPVFEASDAGLRYPIVDGVTHVMIRKAVGLWSRDAVVTWHNEHAEPEHLLIGETPFIGGRLVELAHPVDDDAELLLRAPSSRFVIPVPSRSVREFLERERERRAREPLHPREREDAPPSVLRALWSEVSRVASALGLDTTAGDTAYDPRVYRQVYEAVLRHRHVDVIPVDTILPTAEISAHDYTIERSELMPTSDDAARFIEMAERAYPDIRVLECEIDAWYRT